MKEGLLAAVLAGYGLIMLLLGRVLRDIKVGRAILEAIERTDPEMPDCCARLEVIDEISDRLGMGEK